MKKILIVDDQPEVRELVEVTLHSEDYVILHADTGGKAIEMAKREKPDVIVMDIMMPGADGHKVLSRLRIPPVTVAFT